MATHRASHPFRLKPASTRFWCSFRAIMPILRSALRGQRPRPPPRRRWGYATPSGSGSDGGILPWAAGTKNVPLPTATLPNPFRVQASRAAPFRIPFHPRCPAKDVGRAQPVARGCRAPALSGGGARRAYARRRVNENHGARLASVRRRVRGWFLVRDSWSR